MPAIMHLSVNAVFPLPDLGQLVVLRDYLERVVAGGGAAPAAASGRPAHVQPFDLRAVGIGARHTQHHGAGAAVGEVALRHSDLLLDVEGDVQLVGDHVFAG